ncbi:MAG: DeoR/GlpR transcriptional regulator [Oscillospiraceae bacterium]|nr:DeoR/GlpR transcriptional regulator [Oscillospiraceae bacterium]
MLQKERQQRIIKYVNEHKKVTIQELSRLMDTSVVTIRADLTVLDKKGYLEKVRGGAMAATERFNYEIPVTNRTKRNAFEKRQIGRLAADLVEDDDIIILDSGTTTMEIAKNLSRKKNLTVITHDIQIGAYLSANNYKNCSLIVVGGTLEPRTFTLLGFETLNYYKRLKANKVFLGCDAISIDYGVTNRTLIEADIKAAMVNCADTVCAVADNTKIGKTVFAHVCDITDIDVLITDSIPSSQQDALMQKGVRVIVPEDSNDDRQNR